MITVQPPRSRNSVLSSKWFPDPRDAKAKEDFERQLRNDGVILGRLKEIIEDFINELDSAELTVEDFDKPNWALLQASRLGEKRGLKKIKDLLNFTDGE